MSLESSIERKCVTIARKHGCLLLKIEKQRGWPDRILLAPSGQICFIEFKKPGESLMPLQKHIQQELRLMNFMSEEVDNFSLFLQLVQRLKASSLNPGTPSHTNFEV
jgi:hypothetical protein